MASPDPTLILNPRSDAEFVTWAHEIFGEEAARATPDRLQRRLRERYRNAIVRSLELSGEATLVWYVYRDGRWIPGDPDVDHEGGGR